ncbi:MAG: hypothetical protein RLZZ124_244, partial [Cyanobacteriota bacterium]
HPRRDDAPVVQTDRLGRESALLGDDRLHRDPPFRAVTAPPLQQCRGEADVTDRADVRACRELFPSVPITGAFCNGEIGPVAGATHLHGYTASWGFLVPHPTEA